MHRQNKLERLLLIVFIQESLNFVCWDKCPANIGLAWKNAEDKHSSLFYRSVSDEEKKFYDNEKCLKNDVKSVCVFSSALYDILKPIKLYCQI